MIGQRPPPTRSNSQRYGSGFHGSPVVTMIRSDERSCCGSPCGIEGANERGGAAQDGHALLVHQLPEPVRRPVRRTLGVDDRGAHRAAADHRPWAHDPAHVGGEVDDVAGTGVGLVADLARDRDEEAALDVQYALGTAGRAGCVREQIRVLRVDCERLELAWTVGEQLVERGEHHVLERWRLVSRLFETGEHGDLPAAAQRALDGDRDLRLGVGEALRDGRRGEAREDRHLHGADVRAGVGSDGDLRRHRKVDRYTVSGIDAEPYERFCELRDLRRELAERQLPSRTVLAAEDGRRLRGALGGPAVDAVPGDVELAVDEPGRPLGPA